MSRLDDYNERRAYEKDRRKKIRKALSRRALAARQKIRDEGRCRNPHCSNALVIKPDWHHLVPRSKFGKYDERVHSVDNAVPLCRVCHTKWHQNITVLCRSSLSESEVSFIISVMGDGWIDRKYPEG